VKPGENLVPRRDLPFVGGASGEAMEAYLIWSKQPA